MFSEFLDIEHFSGEGYAGAVADFLRQKYGRLNVGVMLPVVQHEGAVGDRVGQQRLHRLIEEGLALRLRRQR